MTFRRITDDLPIPDSYGDFEEERYGLINKILKLKEEIKRLRRDNYDFWVDAVSLLTE